MFFFPVPADKIIGSQLDRKENKRENWQDICFVSCKPCLHGTIGIHLFSIKRLEFFQNQNLVSPKAAHQRRT